MVSLLKLVFCILCIKLSLSNPDIYRAGIVAVSKDDVNPNKYVPLIQEAAKSMVDILVLPSPEYTLADMSLETSICGPEHYDEFVKAISNAAKRGGLYVVAHLYEKTRCQNAHELIRNNLVFDRNGAIISVYRKPVTIDSPCNTNKTVKDIGTFATDLGVTFGVLMEEDLVFQNLENLKNLKNFVLTGPWSSDISFLSADQFSPTWAYTTNANLVSTSGIYAGNAGLRQRAAGNSNIVIADLSKNGGLDEPIMHPMVKPANTYSFPGEDLSQYVIKPLNLDASMRGYKENVCHGTFCCEFYLKTKSIDSKKTVVNYGLAVFEGVRHVGNRNIGSQSCALVACAGVYKRICNAVNENTNITFDEITISGNFPKTNSAQFPVIVSTEQSKLSPEQYVIDSKTIGNSQQVTVKLFDSRHLLNFGIFGRDFSRDSERRNFSIGKVNDTDGLTSDIYDYIYNEDVKEFFDYVWIRLRVLIVVVSIYVLEML